MKITIDPIAGYKINVISFKDLKKIFFLDHSEESVDYQICAQSN